MLETIIQMYKLEDENISNNKDTWERISEIIILQERPKEYYTSKYYKSAFVGLFEHIGSGADLSNYDSLSDVESVDEIIGHYVASYEEHALTWWLENISHLNELTLDHVQITLELKRLYDEDDYYTTLSMLKTIFKAYGR